MSATMRLGEAFTIPDVVSASDFVLQLNTGVERAADTVGEYVVTPALAEAFNAALAQIGAAPGFGLCRDAILRYLRCYSRFMRSEAPPLAPIFRSRTQGDVLALLLLHPDEEWTLSDLARRLDAPLTTIQDEVRRLTVNGILQDRKVGRARLVRANLNHPAIVPLTQLTMLTFGPQVVIAEEFSDLGAQLVVIFGSWAARYCGHEGPSPADIDVLLIGGELDRRAVYAAAERAEAKLRMQVNPVIRTTDDWSSPNGDPLLAEIKSGPFVIVVGGQE